MARIGMVLENDYPADLRVTKEAQALGDAGHEVHLLCLEFGDRAATEVVDGLTVHRRPLSRTAYRKLHPTILRFPWYRGWWRRAISRFVEEQRLDLLHVHDLPLARAALESGERAGRPVLLDFHENFPAAIAGWGFDRGLTGAIFYPLSGWRAYERDASRRAAGVIVVVPESRERILAHGVSDERVSVVSNTDRVDFGADVEAGDVGVGTPFECLYIGGFGPHRGLDTAIDAFHRLHDSVDARLRLIGDGRIRAELSAAIDAGSGAARIELGRWVPQSEVASHIGTSHVGLVPHLRNDHTETTIPHKLFLYMAMGRPVIVSDCAPLRRVVEATGAGLVFRSGDASDMAAAIERMSDGAERRRMGEAGRQAVRDEYNWSRDGRVLAEFVEGLLAH